MSGMLVGKVGVITGVAGAGMGRGAAMVFAREGAKGIVLADVAEQGGLETLELVRKAGGNAIFVKCDVSDGDQIAELVAKTVSTYGQLDCAFNNAAVTAKRAFLHEIEDADWERHLAVNQTGVWKCMRAQIAQMLAQGTGGSVVCTSSTAGVIGQKGVNAAYAAAKHAVIGLVRSAATQYGTKGIRVNAIVPGPIWTPMLESGYKTRAAAEERYAHRTALGRLGEPGEIGEAAAWLCSDRASFVTGSVLNVDGGVIMVGA